MAEATRRTRDPHRKQRILDSAVELVARNGYAAVNLTDVGAAAGIVGSGIYRHFESKSAILVELFDRVIDKLIINADQALATHVKPEQIALEVIRGHIALTLADRELLQIYVKESRNLPDSDQLRLRWKQRHYLDLLIDVLVSARSDLSRPQAQLLVHAAIGAIHSVLNYQSYLASDELAAQLETIAMGLIGLPVVVNGATEAASPVT